VSAEIVLSGMPFCPSPTTAKRKGSRSGRKGAKSGRRAIAKVCPYTSHGRSNTSGDTDRLSRFGSEIGTPPMPASEAGMSSVLFDFGKGSKSSPKPVSLVYFRDRVITISPPCCPSFSQPNYHHHGSRSIFCKRLFSQRVRIASSRTKLPIQKATVIISLTNQ
jgi:hypothetical protein